MKTWKKIAWGVAAVVVVGGLVALIIYLRGLGTPAPVPTPTPTPTPSPKIRTLGNERFGPHARPAAAANVDVGVVTVRTPDISGASAAPSPHADIVIALTSPAPYAAPTVAPLTSPRPSAAARSPVPSPTPTPIQPPPTFAPLPPPPAPQIKELGIVYAKGGNQKRQVYLRSIDRDQDVPLVSDVFDDFGVALSSAQQKVAFYSNEEGPSDATKARSTLKVVDLATRKVQTLIGGLPGAWPVAWSPNGRKLAVPTADGIFLADVTTGTSLQIPTAKDPGAIVWAPGSLKFYFQAETAPGNHDIFQADGITAGASPVTSTADDETLPSVSSDGQRVMFLKQTPGQAGGPAIVIKSVATGQETSYPETAPAGSYLANLDLNDLVFVQGEKNPRLARFKSGRVQTIGDLGGPTLVSWDRDYQHVFVLADDDQSKALFSVDITSGLAEKIKAGISDTAPNPGR